MTLLPILADYHTIATICSHENAEIKCSVCIIRGDKNIPLNQLGDEMVPKKNNINLL